MLIHWAAEATLGCGGSVGALHERADASAVDSVAHDAPSSANEASVTRSSDATIDSPAVDEAALAEASGDGSPGEGARSDGPAESSSNGAACDGSAGSDGSTGRRCIQDVECGMTGLCAARTPFDASVCCGKGNACCSTSADCCNGNCAQGVCSSEGNRCVSDADCNDGALCLGVISVPGAPSRCYKLPGSACSRSAECNSGDCDGGYCDCLGETGCRTDTDCCQPHAHCKQGFCRLATEGEGCLSDADCYASICLNGLCRCLPAGSVTTNFDACCSRTNTATACTAQGGYSTCSPVLPDCFGGSCVSGLCKCVGSGGICNVDSDCCAGATRCVYPLCQ